MTARFNPVRLALKMWAIRIRINVNRARSYDLALGIPEDRLKQTYAWHCQEVSLRVADLFDPDGRAPTPNA